MLILPLTREQLLTFLPGNGVVTEIGVNRGDFSAAMLNASTPRKLHLIDPWNVPADDREDQSLSRKEQAECVYQKVIKRFENEVNSGVVTIHRAYSTAILDQFDDAYFDWIYVDGSHKYEAVTADLENYSGKVKASGFIVGHDYTNRKEAQAFGNGVVEAVDTFVTTNGWHFLAMTMDYWPTYVICRDRESESATNMYHAFLFNIPGVIEIKNHPSGQYIHHILEYDKQNLRSLFSF